MIFLLALVLLNAGLATAGSEDDKLVIGEMFDITVRVGIINTLFFIEYLVALLGGSSPVELLLIHVLYRSY